MLDPNLPDDAVLGEASTEELASLDAAGLQLKLREALVPFHNATELLVRFQAGNLVLTDAQRSKLHSRQEMAAYRVQLIRTFLGGGA